ncbi:aldo/keto reductase [Acetobacter fabarum]|uniref:aldo/keto reductase n=2 Tax=Acetobacter fabarum TaxID=483199 RepID=UPI002156B0E5|nr:aldo/keto reductase [Acetobacter fabarum]GBQ38723.1 2,5-diketo-D-gluconate reductase [Acetobacter fabarum DSM 19596]
MDPRVGARTAMQICSAIRRSGINRSEMFVTTKLWVTDYGYDEALRAFDLSLDRLGLDYLDLYLLHWPTPEQFDKTLAAYHAAEKLLTERRVRAIGVCNFVPSRLETLISQTDVVPAINQVELHPFYNQRETREADARDGIAACGIFRSGGAFSL